MDAMKQRGGGMTHLQRHEYAQKHLRYELLKDAMGGDIEALKNQLVEHIQELFQSPDKWPMTDDQRCAALKEIYQFTVNIRTLELAKRSSTPTPETV